MASSASSRKIRILLSSGVVLGWLAHDFAVFLPAGDPATAAALLPGSLVALVIGVGAGILLRSLGVWLSSCALLAAASAATVVADLPFARSQLWFPRAALLFCASYGLAWVLFRWMGRGALRAGLIAGVLAVVTMTAWRGNLPPASRLLLAAAAVALVAGFLRPTAVRVAITALALVFPALRTAAGIRADLRPTRSDLAPPSVTADATQKSLLLVVLDTARADRMGVYGAARLTTPALGRLAAEHATLYTQAVATSPWTWPSHASLLTGLAQSEHDVPGRVGADTPTLATRLRDAGYRTAGIVANSAQLRPGTGIANGFEHYDDRDGAFAGGYLALAQVTGGVPRAGNLIYRDATRITELALSWLDEHRQEPFFLFLNYKDPHFPYLPPAPFDTAFGPEQPTDPLDPEGPLRPLVYDRELLYMDSELGRLFDGLRARDAFDDTVIVVTSDHGESLGDRGFWLHGWNLYEELVRVPLLIKPAGGRTHAEDHTPLSGADVFGMMLSAVGIETPTRSDLLPCFAEWYYDRKRVGWWESQLGKELRHDLVSWRQDGLKLIVSSTGTVEAYDLAADPAEAHPLALQPAQAEAARATASAWWKAHEKEQDRLPSPPDEETRARLRALGYGGD